VGARAGYFASEDDLQAFSDDLKHLLVYQKAAFNSPVWFNCGFEKHPQCSACFINSVQDTMDSILTLAKTEGMLFKFGSGTGTNLSPIRSSKELLAGGGTASGPVSFMKGYDAFAGVIKSGGKTRRAAKMVILNADHPTSSSSSTARSRRRRRPGRSSTPATTARSPGPAYSSVFFQNSNNSVRVTDEFMRAVLDDGEWQTRAVTDGEPCGHLQGARPDAADRRGDARLRRPRHAVRHDGQRLAHLPEHGAHQREQPVLRVHVPRRLGVQPGVDQPDEVRRRGRRVRRPAFEAACRTLITAQEIIVDNASYPTKAIEKNSHDYRPLGLGYANLGALLMSRGLPYDSDAGATTRRRSRRS
jgi:ribonucleoside-diphosphate reductase alpha chain